MSWFGNEDFSEFQWTREGQAIGTRDVGTILRDVMSEDQDVGMDASQDRAETRPENLDSSDTRSTPEEEDHDPVMDAAAFAISLLMNDWHRDHREDDRDE